MKICIATPMYGGNAKSMYVSSVMELMSILGQRGHQVFQTVITNESLITRARNTLVHEFLKTDADALLFIDADHGFKGVEVADMIESGKDLIGGIYPMKAINWANVRKAAIAGKENLEEYAGYFAVNFLAEEQTFQFNQPFKVRDIGTGMMFITRKVFEDLKPVCKSYKNNSINNGSIEDTTITEYFTTMIDPADNILLSEDYAFCYMWRELGNDVWAAPWVRLSHAGDYNFYGSFLRMLEIQNMSVSQPVESRPDSSPSSDTTSEDSE